MNVILWRIGILFKILNVTVLKDNKIWTNILERSLAAGGSSLFSSSRDAGADIKSLEDVLGRYMVCWALLLVAQ